MSAPTNTAATTATAIASLPASISQTVDDAGTTYTVWYSYTAVAGDEVLGVFGYGDASVYLPDTAVFLGPASAPIAYLNLQTGDNKCCYLPVDEGTTYYFRFRTNAGNPSPANLTVSVLKFAQTIAPVGSIGINDDVYGFPMCLLEAAAGTVTPLQYVLGFAPGESIDVLDSGVVAASDNDPGDTTKIYDTSYQLLTTVPDTGWPITTNRTTKFYTARGATDKVVLTLSATGSVIGTTGIVATAGQSIDALAVNVTDTILYYFQQNPSTVIRRWDITNNVALTDLVTVAGRLMKDAYCLSTGQLVVLDSTADEILILNTDGTTAQSWPFTGALGDRFCRGYTEDTIWIWNKGGSTTETITEVSLIDGTSGIVITGGLFAAGTQLAAASASPQRFGNSNSCGLYITRTATVDVPTSGPLALQALRDSGRLGDSTIVRIRRAPHQSDEQERIFYSKFQLDCEVGVGVPSGQGSDPTVELRWSNDGGYTWTNWRTLTVGRQGEYRARAIAWQLGQSRDRVYEVRQSDPVRTAWLTAYLDIEGGSS